MVLVDTTASNRSKCLLAALGPTVASFQNQKKQTRAL